MILSGTLEDVRQSEDADEDPVKAIRNARRGVWTVIFVFLGEGMEGTCEIDEVD